MIYSILVEEETRFVDTNRGIINFTKINKMSDFIKKNIRKQ